jgi:Spy/CpxP family protein refolding chaperone
MHHHNTIATAACLCLALLLLAVGGASAHQRISRAEERSQHLKGLLSLTEDQAKQVAAILKKHEPKPGDSGSLRTRAKAERSERAASDKEIQALLTPDQLKKFESYKKARRSETDTRRRPRGEEYQ